MSLQKKLPLLPEELEEKGNGRLGSCNRYWFWYNLISQEQKLIKTISIATVTVVSPWLIFMETLAEITLYCLLSMPTPLECNLHGSRELVCLVHWLMPRDCNRRCSMIVNKWMTTEACVENGCIPIRRRRLGTIRCNVCDSKNIHSWVIDNLWLRK